MNILAGIGQWLLKLFLSGLFNKVMTKIEMEAKAKEEAAKLHAESTVEASQTEATIAKKQADVAIKYAEQKNQPKDPVDPFGNNSWNQGA